MKHDGILFISCLCQFLPTNTRNFFCLWIFDHSPHCFQSEMVWKSNKTIHSNSNLLPSIRLNEKSLWIKSHPKHLQCHWYHIRFWFLTLHPKKDWDIWCHGNCMFPFFFQVKNIDVQDYFVTVRIFCFFLKPYTIDSANSELSELKPSCSHRP